MGRRDEGLRSGRRPARRGPHQQPLAQRRRGPPPRRLQRTGTATSQAEQPPPPGAASSSSQGLAALGPRQPQGPPPAHLAAAPLQPAQLQALLAEDTPPARPARLADIVLAFAQAVGVKPDATVEADGTSLLLQCCQEVERRQCEKAMSEKSTIFKNPVCATERTKKSNQSKLSLQNNKHRFYLQAWHGEGAG